MAGHAKSISSKKREASQVQEAALEEAVLLYRGELTKLEGEHKSLQGICAEVQKKWQKQHQEVVVSVETVRRRVKGGRGCQEANLENHGWLTSEEEESVVEYCLELAARGFPFNHTTLKFHVDSILQTRLGKNFPETGVGTNWTN